MRRRVLWLCALLVASATSRADDRLGRLFFTPEERARLDALRAGTAVEPLAAEGPAIDLPLPALAPSLPVAPPSPVAVNGLVIRERGPATAWINGAAGTRRDLTPTAGEDLRIGRRAVEVSDSADTRARVKPGQIFEPALGRVVEAFEQQTPSAPLPEPSPQRLP